MSGGSSSEVPGTFPVTPKPDKPISSRTRSKSRGRTLFPPPKTSSPQRSPTSSPPPSPERSERPEPEPEMSKERTTPKIEPKLAGQSNYAEWILSIKQTLRLYDHGEDSIWDIVTGEIPDPSGGSIIKLEKSTAKSNKQWIKDNDFAVLTMKRNCEPEAIRIIGLCESAHQAYLKLQARYEGKTITDLGVVIRGVLRSTFDDRKQTIEEHVEDFERKWGFMESTLTAKIGDDDKKKSLKEFADSLRQIAQNDRAKAELLLLTLPPFYSNLVENLRSKDDYTYGDISHQIRMYVPARQKGSRKNTEEGTRDTPVVLKTSGENKGNGKTCTYCQSKGWRGNNHTADECFTRKREEKKKDKKKTNKAKAENDDDSDEETHKPSVTIAAIRVRLAGTNDHEKAGEYLYDTGASHHTTNELHRLSDIREVNIRVKAFNGTYSICKKIGTMSFEHNGTIIHHKET